MVYQVALKPKSLARSGISKGGVGRSGGRVKGLLSQLASPRRQLPPVEDSVPLVWGVALKEALPSFKCLGICACFRMLDGGVEKPRQKEGCQLGLAWQPNLD